MFRAGLIMDKHAPISEEAALHWEFCDHDQHHDQIHAGGNPPNLPLPGPLRSLLPHDVLLFG